MLKFQEEREAVTDQRPAYDDFGNLRIGDKKFRPLSRNAFPNTIGEVQRDVRRILADGLTLPTFHQLIPLK